MLLQLLSETGNQLEKTEKFRSDGMASDLVKVRKEIWILLYHLIRDKFSNIIQTILKIKSKIRLMTFSTFNKAN